MTQRTEFEIETNARLTDTQRRLSRLEQALEVLTMALTSGLVSVDLDERQPLLDACRKEVRLRYQFERDPADPDWSL